MKWMKTLYILLFLVSPCITWSQTTYTISFTNKSYQHIVKKPKLEFKDSISLQRYLSNLQTVAISKGYLLASVDNITYSATNATVDFRTGDKINNIKLSIAEEELQFIRKQTRLNEKFISQLPFTPSELAKTIKKIQQAYLNSGFPFVKIQLKDHAWNSEVISAELNISPGKYTTWTKINVRGDSTISEKYISNLLAIKKGDPYVEVNVTNISSRIEQVPFMKEIKPSELLFTKEGVELYLYLESVPISSANGIIGFQPDPTTDRLSITGEIHLKLLNVLKRGELLDLKWQSIRDQTQSLESQLNYPFLFNTSFGLDGAFDLYKRDSSFLELNSSIGVQYFLKRGNFLKVFYSAISSNVLSGGLNNPSFNNLGSVTSNNYGISYTSNQVDYLPNPSRGVNLLLQGSAGSRKSQLNDSSEIVKSTVFRGKVELNLFVPIFKRHVLRLASKSEFYVADEIFENEVYRYGGLGSQRGFNEDELFATTRTTATLEYRFLLDRNSFVFAFYDQSWYENNARSYYNDAPFGFGVGFAFNTNFGVFSISYALGKQFNNPILFSNSKVHFGYIVYF